MAAISVDHHGDGMFLGALVVAQANAYTPAALSEVHNAAARRVGARRPFHRETGRRPARLRFANGATIARPANLMVNGSTVATVSFAPTGLWPTWATVSLNAGSNTIRLDYPTSTPSTWELPDIKV